MVKLEATVDGPAVASFNAALAELASSLGEGLAYAPRRAALTLCNTFRAKSNTRKAPPFARSGEYAITKADARPKWLTKGDTKLRRWTVDRTPVGRMGFEAFGQNRTEVRKKKLKLYHAGLARQSWGWVMRNIFTGAAPDTPWPRRKKERDPREAVKHSFASVNPRAAFPNGVARISNRLDYILATLKISVDQAYTKAANKLIRPIINARLRKGGMSPAEIKAAGHAAHREWIAQFG